MWASLLSVAERPNPQHISGDTKKEKQPSTPALIGTRHQKHYSVAVSLMLMGVKTHHSLTCS